MNPARSDAGAVSAWPTREQLEIPTVGRCERPVPPAIKGPFVEASDRILLAQTTSELAPFLAGGLEPPSFERAGPRRTLRFDPERLACGIVTCGGLCPGLNNVIRSIVLSLSYVYGVRRIFGFRYGYAGLAPSSPYAPLPLEPAVVETLHHQGGTLLGTSRGPQDVAGMVDTLERLGVGILFVLGGDGGLRGAAAIHEEIRRRNGDIAVVGVPKTIDNDLLWTWRSFGFSTAVEAAATVIQTAHAEARAAWNGISLVKLMGRHSGFIAAHATLANSDVNFCLVPEVPLVLEGERGFLAALERRIDRKHHAVIVVAEGTAQDLLRVGREVEYDASGNPRLIDVGVFLRDAIKRFFAERKKQITLRYIDPSYVIRGMPANPTDAHYCLALGQHAVHAGMAGRTNLVVSMWNHHYVHVPIPLAVERCRKIDPQRGDWQNVLSATGQEE